MYKYIKVIIIYLLMGVPAYFSYIIKNYSKIIRTIDNLKEVHNLYLDCNSIIYDAMYSIKENKNNIDDVIIKSICQRLHNYIIQIKPTQRVFIAFDGVAPVAKLEQQRTRRIRSKLIKSITDELIPNNFKLKFDGTCITPGTQFMNKLANEIKTYFSNNNKFNTKEIIISCSDEIGEGEHKLFEYIRSNPIPHKKENTVVYGLDADLIMLSINHLPVCPNIFLFRETPEFIKQLDNTLDPNKLYMIDIPLLNERISCELNQYNVIKNEMKSSKTRDYIFLCFLLGNDFMPHFPALNIRTTGIQILIDVYGSIFTDNDLCLVKDCEIQWRNFKSLVKLLAQEENNYLIKEYNSRNKKEKINIPNNTPEEKLEKMNKLPCIQREIERYINPTEKGWQNRYYEKLFHVEINEERRKQICFNYLEALEWTTKYYTLGCVDWRWKYNYNYAPLLEDLVKYIPYFQTTFFKQVNTNCVSPYTQLSYVLPRSSLNLLPKNIESKLLSNHPEWYNEDFKIEWAYCKYLWESHLILPNININTIENLIKQ